MLAGRSTAGVEMGARAAVLDGPVAVAVVGVVVVVVGAAGPLLVSVDLRVDRLSGSHLRHKAG